MTPPTMGLSPAAAKGMERALKIDVKSSPKTDGDELHKASVY